jgi:paraquat-inducible protein B
MGEKNTNSNTFAADVIQQQKNENRKERKLWFTAWLVTFVALLVSNGIWVWKV